MNNANAIPIENNAQLRTGELIQVFTGRLRNDQVKLVDARMLHRFLSIDTDFRKWVARRIEEYGFQEGEDFRSFLGESSGGRRSREYHITLDMGKELAMVERNEKGRQARCYFIECEKRLQQLAPNVVATIMGQTIGTDGFHCLAAVVDGKVKRLPAASRRGAKNHIWSQVHKAFSVVTAEDIPASQMDAARNFVASYALEGEWMPKERKAIVSGASKRYLVSFDDDGKEVHQAIAPEAVVMTPGQFLKAITEENGIFVESEALFDLITNASQRLKARTQGQVKKLF